jgi:hypothetical protein
VFVGTSVTELLPIANGYNGVVFYAHAGTTYQIAVADYEGAEGTFDLAFSGLPALPEMKSNDSNRLSDGRFVLPINGIKGQSFAVQASTNLLSWETVSIDTILSDHAEFIDADAAHFPMRFYRVVPLEVALASDLPPARLTLGEAHATAPTGFTLRISGMAGQFFILRASSDLIHWEEVHRGWVVGDSFDFLDPDAASRPARFFQVVPLP